MYPKPKRVQDDPYREYVRSHPCCACPRGLASEPHHLKSKGSGGDDYFCVPLCRYCHQEIETVGRQTFQDRKGINLWEVCAKLLVEWMKREDNQCTSE